MRRDGREALARLDTFDPDVVTLDINMPEMDSLTCLDQIITLAPRPMVMVSSLTETGAHTTLEALKRARWISSPNPAAPFRPVSSASCA